MLSRCILRLSNAGGLPSLSPNSNHQYQVFHMSDASPAPDCYFCKVSRGQADPFIFENASFIGIFDTNPVNPGHALVIPRRHVVSIFDLNDTEHLDYFDALRAVRNVIETTDLKALYQEMLHRDYLKDRPQDHIESVLRLPFFGENA